jgi:hypothetical protein
MSDSRVRVYVNGSAPVVFPAIIDGMGFWAEIRQAQGSGYEAIPSHRVRLDPENLRRLPPGEDAEFEYVGPFMLS